MGEQPILGVDDLLGRYRAEGQAESSGSFTLDPRKAMERLAQFQLPSMYHWILKVIQSLHLAGATEIRINAGINGVTVDADVVPGGFDSIDDLLAQLLADNDQVNPSLRHLAAGLQGCLAVSPRLIQMIIAHDGRQREYLLKSGGWRDGRRVPDERRRERFHLNLVRNFGEQLGSGWFMLNTDIFDLLFRRQAALDREQKVIDLYCNYSACRVVTDGRVSNESRFGRPRFNGYKVRLDPNPAAARPNLLQSLYEPDLVRKVAHAHHHLVEMVVPSSHPRGFRLEPESHATVTNRNDPAIKEKAEKSGLSRAYAIRMDLAQQGEVLFWEDGVILGRRTVPTECRGLVALVDARDLGKDLTTLQVLEDQRFERMLDEIQAAGRTLKARLQENLHLMPASDYLIANLGLLPA